MGSGIFIGIGEVSAKMNEKPPLDSAPWNAVLFKKAMLVHLLVAKSPAQLDGF